MANVLTVLPDLPALEGGAAGRCAVGFLLGLKAYDVAYRALAARRPGSVAGQPPPELGVEVAEADRSNRWRHRLETLTRPCGELSRGSFGARVRELAATADLIHLDQVDAAWCSVGVPVPAVVNIHYLVRQDRHINASRNLPALLVRRLGELAAVRRHVYLSANSPVVADALRRTTPRAEVVVSPLSLDPSHYRRAPLDGSPTVAFIGTGFWPPTTSALRRLVERVWPRVLREVPQATLRVAGRGTDRLGLAGAQVEVLGAVPSAVEFLQGASLLAFPLERGSGMKVKVLEAIACGVPVVTTPSGAEGLQPDDGVVVETSGSDERLAAAMVELLRDDAARRQRGDAAHRLFMSRYTPEQAVAPLVALYERILR
jgi:glycosyltransferase involved in cell wall biosynthesis